MATHLPYGGSAANRWLACGQATPRSAGVENPETPAMKEGTRLHALLERVVRGKMNLDALPITDRVWIAPVMAHLSTLTGYVEAERFVRIGTLPAGGTADILVWQEEARTLHVIDFKTGRGYVPETTPQLKVYALGALHAAPVAIDTIVATIVQPECQPVVRSTTYSFGEMLAFAEEVEEAVKNRVAIAGEHCRYCPARHGCPEFRAYTFGSFLAEKGPTTTVELPAPATATSDELGQSLGAVEALESWIEAVKAEARERMLRGQEVTGHVLLEGNRERSWVNEGDAFAWAMRTFTNPDNYAPRKFVSVAGMEALAKKHNVQLDPALVRVERRQPRLAPATTKGVRYAPASTDDIVSEISKAHVA